MSTPESTPAIEAFRLRLRQFVCDVNTCFDEFVSLLDPDFIASLGQAATKLPAPEAGDQERLRIVTAGIRYGYIAGHNDSVEACYGDPDAVAADYAPEILGELGITPPAPEAQRDAVIAAVTEALGDAYDCQRVWDAWRVGTMGQDDFALVAEDSDRVAEIADAAIEAMRPNTPPAAAPAPEVGEVGELADRLGWIAAQLGDIGWSDDSASVTRAAALLQQPPAPAPVVVPVAASERLPKPNTKVLAHYFNSLGKGRTICAIWVPAKTRSDSDGEDDFTEYDEVTDKFYWPEGWYEVIEYWDDLGYAKVNEGEVVYWQPLPKWPAHAVSLPQAGEGEL